MNDLLKTIIMKVEKAIPGINFNSNPSPVKYFICFIMAILAVMDSKAQEQDLGHFKEVIWSSKLAQVHIFDDVLTSLNLPDEVTSKIDEFDIQLAKTLLKEKVQLKEKTLEIQGCNAYDRLFLVYYLNQNSDNDLKNSVVTFPLAKLPTDSDRKEVFWLDDVLENVNDRSLANKMTDVISVSDLLGQNYPNPFVTNTIIEFELPDNFSSAKIMISDIRGHQIHTFDLWDPSDSQIRIGRDKLSKGVYFYHLLIDDQHISTRKMICE